MREQNRKTPGSGAKVERAFDAYGIGNPRLQSVGQKLGDIRSRNDDALVDIETKFPQPRFMREIGGGNSIIHTALYDLQQLAALDMGKMGVEKRLEAVERKVQRMQNDIRCFVVGVCHAVTETKATRDKP